MSSSNFLDCWSYSSRSKDKHGPLPGSWERIFAPCRCSFIGSSAGSLRESYLDADDIRRAKPCPLGTERRWRYRILYINHVTGESTLHCPCASCSPEWKGVPCLTLGSLFGDEQPDISDGSLDSPIPAQDLTRVGKPCWRLGSLFDEATTEGLELDEDPVMPAQDVGLSIFDDMPGFALARNHIDSRAWDMPPVSKALDAPLKTMPEEPPLTASTCVNPSPLRQGDWTFKGVLSLPITTPLVSLKSCQSFFASRVSTT